MSMSWEIVTRQEVSAFGNIPESTLESEWYDWAASIMEAETGYANIGESATVSSETHDGDGTDLLRVDYPPIVSVTSVSIDDTAISSTRYKVYSHYIRLTHDIDDTVPDYFADWTHVDLAALWN